ncbi:hypothetical protein MNBD_NITROSPINAE03-1402 [hydrothermal vent metagenome]|uniref:HTH cro/C1-type domain-containing protein n=1 Tax=hydrothermal vent metagenome TaxID=652676 RepID=A0A3B1BXD5_9ZZZZ
MKQTFRDRLRLLMKEDKPYTWARKVGIEKGLFQYYWQKGKIPTYDNLIKIQNFTGCSLDWLLTGKAVAVDQLESLPMVKELSPVYGEMNLRRIKSLEDVKSVYASRDVKDIELLEGILEKLKAGVRKRPVRKK